MPGASGTDDAAPGLIRAGGVGAYAAAVLVAVLCAALVAATWVGFIESDDLEYARAAPCGSKLSRISASPIGGCAT